MTFQQLILALDKFWADRGCRVQQPYDLEVGAGTFNPATFLRVLGPDRIVCLCRTFPTAYRRPVWGKPKPAPALLSVSGDFETFSCRFAGNLPREPQELRRGPPGPRYPLCRR